MDCTYIIGGTTYDKDGFMKYLLNMKPSEASKYMPNVESVPDMPFLKNWHELALKRMVRYAAENGFDKIAWITGQQTADRYDLSRQVDRIEYRNGQLWAFKNGEKVIEQTANTPKELEGLVGKDIANKILEQDAEMPDKLIQIKGDALKVGASWAYSLYDKMIPQYLKKFGKKYGAEIGTTEINEEKQQSFTIPPKLRQAALREGMPLFAKREKLSAKIDTTGFLPTEVEKQMEAAKGRPKATFKEKASETILKVRAQRAHFPDLQSIEDKVLRAKVNDILRRHQEVPETAKNKTLQLIDSFTKGLSKDGYKVYRLNIFLADMMRDIRNGLTYDGKLPFGFKTTQEVSDAYDKFQKVAEQNPEIAKALKARKDAVNDIKKRLVDAKILKKEVLTEDDYFHHQIIKYWAEKKYGMAIGSQDVRAHWRPWMAARKGSMLNYNTDYIEAEYTAISQQLAQIETVETLKRLKKEADVYVDLKNKSKAINLKNFLALSREKGEPDLLSSWKQSTDIATANIAKMASKEMLEYDSEWQELVDGLSKSYDDWKTGKGKIPDQPYPGVNDGRWFDFLAYLVNTKKPGANWAATILKNIKGKDKLIKDTLGNRFVTYETLMPEDYVDWKPDPGKGWYWANVITDKILEKIQRGELDPQDVEAKRLLAKGSDTIWIIPKGLAKTLDDFKGQPDPAFVGQIADKAMRAWKQYILLNPYSVVRYNLNNMSGDLDATLAYAPSIVTKYGWQAFRDLRKWHKRKKLDPKIQKELDFAQASGAIQSGFSMQEVDDVYAALKTDRDVKKVLLDEDPNWFTKGEWFGVKRAVSTYWSFVRRATALRENTLRLAAYRFFMDNKDKRLYGASKPEEVDAITDPREKAAKMARELLGDYGNISKSGEYIRKRLVPFYCVPQETEILTRDGWKTYDRLVDKESVLTYNLSTRTTEWQEIRDYAVFDFNDKLITLSNKYGFKFQFTAEHRVPVLEQGAIKIVRAKDLKSHYKVPIVKTSPQSNHIVEWISINSWERTLEPYSGKVWCPRTPNTTWVMRQDGKVMITGNSWMEINAPRYVYLMRNTKYENRDVDSVKKQMVAVAGKKLVLSATKMAVRMSMFMGAVMLWNLTMFPDEEEELGETGRRQMHIILGRREDGSIITLRLQGAFSDALSFFALEDWPADMKDVLEGKRTVGEKLQEIPIALLNRGVQSIRPEPKMLGELISGKSFYPDVTRPMPIRDRVEHVLRTFKLDRMYREVLERPGRGKTEGAPRVQQAMEHFVNDLKSLLVYESDPGLMAYYDARKIAFDWLAKTGDEKRFGGRPTKKGNAFYYYKQAMKYGDPEAAQRYLKKYYELGGTWKSRMASIKYAHPLSSIPAMKKNMFRRSLDTKQQERLLEALRWYHATYH